MPTTTTAKRFHPGRAGRDLLNAVRQSQEPIVEAVQGLEPGSRQGRAGAACPSPRSCRRPRSSSSPRSSSPSVCLTAQHEFAKRGSRGGRAGARQDQAGSGRRHLRLIWTARRAGAQDPAGDVAVGESQMDGRLDRRRCRRSASSSAHSGVSPGCRCASWPA